MSGTDELIYKLEDKYNFECEGGELKNSKEWQELKEKIAWMRKSVRENESCDNWGSKKNGSFGPCGECEYCSEFQND